MSKNNILRTIGINIKHARNEKGLTQEQLAPMIGLSRTQLVNIEGGNTSTSIEKIIKLAEVLEIDVSILLNIGIERCPTCGQILTESEHDTNKDID